MDFRIKSLLLTSLTFLCFLLISSCVKELPLSEDKILESFGFDPESSDILISTEGTFIGTQVEVFVPTETDVSALRPKFQVSDFARVKIDGVKIISEQTQVDFSTPKILTVIAEDGSEQSYSISVVRGFSGIDEAIKTLMNTYNIPGAQLAITKNEKLVYAQSYGMADVANETEVSNHSLFRIASVSKPVTQAAILKLVDDGVISLDDKVFGADGILGTTYGSGNYQLDVQSISVRHLMEHKSGWINSPNDPMFSDSELSQADLIGNLLDGQPLSFGPGSTYYYLNIGYCILGRVIEHASGKPYETYVRDELLTPTGITEMKIGGNTLNEIKPDEVTYLGQESLGPYEMNITRMDSHGGWIASSIDLLKFMVTIDRSSTVPDLISSDLLNETYFTKSWWYHTGSLPGTSAILSRRSDSFSYSFVCNTRTMPVEQVLDGATYAIEAELVGRISWPTYDLFDSY